MSSVGNESETATKFNTNKNVKHFEEIFRYYDLDVYKWTKCFIAGNCPVNVSMPLARCNYHKLYLEVNQMLSQNLSMSKAFGSVKDTMVQC